jgi:hypothetical protein
MDVELIGRIGPRVRRIDLLRVSFRPPPGLRRLRVGVYC